MFDLLSSAVDSVGSFIGDTVDAVGDFFTGDYTIANDVAEAGFSYVDNWFDTDFSDFDNLFDADAVDTITGEVANNIAPGAGGILDLAGGSPTDLLKTVSDESSSFLGGMFDSMSDKEKRSMLLGGVGAMGKQYLEQQQLEELYKMKKDLQKDSKKHEGAYYVKTPTRYPNKTKR